MTSFERFPPPKKRKWWLALLLHWFLGAGYLYIGQPRRYFLYISLPFLTIFFTLLPRPEFIDPRLYIGAVIALLLCIYIVSSIDIFMTCARRKEYHLKRYNKWWIYLGSYLCGVVIYSFNLSLLHIFDQQRQIRPYFIPSGNNIPTLTRGDYILADSCGFDCIKPQRGDMVILKLPTNESIDYIERIVGLPGDTIQLTNGVVYLNGEALPKLRAPEDYFQVDDFGNAKKIAQFKETLPNGPEYTVLDLTPNGPLDNTPEYYVPEGHYFVMGDNRDNSADSRILSQIGYVPAKNIYAKPLFIYWSNDLSRIGKRVNQ